MDIINKFLPIVLSILMSANLAGCGEKNQTEADKSPSYTKSVGVTAETFNDSSSKSPEELTLEDYSHINVCGYDLKMPCKPSDFTDDFSFVPGEDSDGNSFNIVYKDNVVGSIITDTTTDGKISTMFSFDTESNFNYNGFCVGMLHNDLQKYFGDPIKQLCDSNGNIFLTIYKVQEDFSVTFTTVLCEKGKIDTIRFSYITENKIWE